MDKPAIMTLTNLKNDSCLLTKNYNDPILHGHYKTICKNLEYNIKVAKRIHFNIGICNYKNKIETKWNVIKMWPVGNQYITIFIL